MSVLAHASTAGGHFGIPSRHLDHVKLQMFDGEKSSHHFHVIFSYCFEIKLFFVDTRFNTSAFLTTYYQAKARICKINTLPCINMVVNSSQR